MRKIKFRGKRVVNGEWVEGDGIVAVGNDYCSIPLTKNVTSDDYHMTLAKVIPETVGQFTGLHDKDGKEIWEGDFIKLDEEYKGHGQNPTYVIFHYSKWMTQGTQYFGHKFDLTSFSLDRMIVIGNIHDNPELLKQ